MILHYHTIIPISLLWLGIYATPKDVSKIVDEVLLMEQFRHPNVMTLVGVCVSSENSALGPSIVMPFMIHGSLLEFLRGRGKEQLTIPDSADSVQVWDYVLCMVMRDDDTVVLKRLNVSRSYC